MKHYLTVKCLYWAKSGLHVHTGPARKLTSTIFGGFVACVLCGFVCLVLNCFLIVLTGVTEGTRIQAAVAPVNFPVDFNLESQ